MLIAAAVCPHPPLLVPEVTGTADPGDRELRRLRAACREAVAALLGAAPDLIAVVGGAGPDRRVPARRTRGKPARLRRPVHAGRGPGPAALADHGEVAAHRGRSGRPAGRLVGDRPGAVTADCLNLGEKLAALAPRVALLVMGDGPGRRARAVPGAADPGADRYDDQVAGALAAADPAALAALDPRRDEELFVAGRAAWQVLAGAASPGAFTADLRYAAAPFEVSYYVASWRRAH